MGTQNGVNGPGTPGEDHGQWPAGDGPPPLTRQEIGERLRILRTYRKWTQLQLATAAGFGNGVVCHTERGEREMALHEAEAYARLLCFCLDAFVRRVPNGQWDLMACLLPYTPPTKGPEEVN